MSFIISSILTWIFVAILLPTLRKKIVDTPNNRSSHQVPTPRGGGLAFVVVGTILTFLFTNEFSRWIPIICLPLAITGFIDDYKSLPAFLRYVIQVMTAIGLLCVAKISIPIWSILFFLIMITAIINSVNFMDGLDGLVAGCGVLLMLATSSWELSGAIFGFLLWNWNPAKVFMGDVGSTYIGAVFAGMLLQQTSYIDIIKIFLVGFPLFADAGICILRRFHNGDNVFQAHRQHLFQRLNRAGWSHSKVSSLYIFASFLLLSSAYLGGIRLVVIALAVETLLAIYLDKRFAVKFGPA